MGSANHTQSLLQPCHTSPTPLTTLWLRSCWYLNRDAASLPASVADGSTYRTTGEV